VLQRRGPDSSRTVCRAVAPGLSVVFCGTVLHFRGSLTVQPLELDGNLLLWNGEVFAGLQVAHFLCIAMLPYCNLCDLGHIFCVVLQIILQLS